MSGGGSFPGTHLPDPLGNAIASAGGGELDPLQLFATNQPGGANYIANHPMGPTVLPPPAWNINPHFYNPNSFMQRQPSAPGIYNAMAAQLAGPQYNPHLLHPVQPTQPQGAMGGMKGGLGQGVGGMGNIGAGQGMNRPLPQMMLPMMAHRRGGGP